MSAWWVRAFLTHGGKYFLCIVTTSVHLDAFHQSSVKERDGESEVSQLLCSNRTQVMAKQQRQHLNECWDDDKHAHANATANKSPKKTEKREYGIQAALISHCPQGNISLGFCPELAPGSLCLERPLWSYRGLGWWNIEGSWSLCVCERTL